jgi:hypothetical protein
MTHRADPIAAFLRARLPEPAAEPSPGRCPRSNRGRKAKAAVAEATTALHVALGNQRRCATSLRNTAIIESTSWQVL